MLKWIVIAAAIIAAAVIFCLIGKHEETPPSEDSPEDDFARSCGYECWEEMEDDERRRDDL